MNRMSKTEIPAASGTNITSNASAISTAASSSTAQRTFLSKYRLHKKFVAAARVLLLVAFLSVWELTASHQIIDSFIFSSPSKIARCFLDMVADRSIFLHLGVTLYETIVSFLLVIVFSILTDGMVWFVWSVLFWPSSFSLRASTAKQREKCTVFRPPRRT